MTPVEVRIGPAGAERELREVARSCLQAALEAVDPAQLVSDHLRTHPAPQVPGAIHLVAVGKAAVTMTSGARAVLGDRLRGGVLILPRGQPSASAKTPGSPRTSGSPPPEPPAESLPPGFLAFKGGHPVPDAGSVEGSEAILRLAEGLTEKDLLLCLISGGGSALMTLPAEGVPLAAVQETTDLLLQAGATIQELNCVRKHLDRLKGGRLARAAAPARVLALVLSDVVGDRPDVIASGPVSPDPTTFRDAVRVLDRLRVTERVPSPVRDHLARGRSGEVEESPGGGDRAFRRVEWRLVGHNRIAVDAARREAGRLGYRTGLLSSFLTGEAREVGRVLAAAGREMRRTGDPVAPPACLVAAGETTVTVVGAGRGGRNQEVALGAAMELAGEEGILVASMGTDGIDGPTDAAGAVADGGSIARARALGLDPRTALAHNDAYPFFRTLDDLILTGPTGTNVMDIQLVVVAGPASEPASGSGPQSAERPAPEGGTGTAP
jgi:glycerate 2-kinase